MPIMSGVSTHARELAKEMPVHRPRFSSPPEGVFSIYSLDLRCASAAIRQSIREDLYAAVHAARDERMNVRNDVLLKEAHINAHDTHHQDRDALIVMKLFDAFSDKLDQTMKEPLIVASMVHDREYIPAARQHASMQLDKIRSDENTQIFRDLKTFARMYRPLLEARDKWLRFLTDLDRLEMGSVEHINEIWSSSNPFPRESIGKVELDPHAELGESMIRSWYESQEFQGVFDDWSEDQKNVAALAILDHSNGSKYSPFSVPREAQVLRLADKLDNTYQRVPEYLLDKWCLNDPVNFHRFVPTAIRNMEINVDRKSKRFSVHYNVVVETVEKIVKKHDSSFFYNEETFLKDFDRAYGQKSMRIAAEVVHGLFAEEHEMYSETAVFEVYLHFASGRRERIVYDRMPTSPQFS